MMLSWSYYATRRPRPLFGHFAPALWRGTGEEVEVDVHYCNDVTVHPAYAGRVSVHPAYTAKVQVRPAYDGRVTVHQCPK